MSCVKPILVLLPVLTILLSISTVYGAVVTVNIYEGTTALNGYLCFSNTCYEVVDGSVTFTTDTLPVTVVFFEENIKPTTNATRIAVFEVSGNMTIDIAKLQHSVNLKPVIVDASSETVINVTCVDASNYIPLRNTWVRTILFNNSITIRFTEVPVIIIPPPYSWWILYHYQKAVINGTEVKDKEYTFTGNADVEIIYYPLLKYNIPFTNVPIGYVIAGIIGFFLFIGFIKFLAGRKTVVEVRKPKYLR